MKVISYHPASPTVAAFHKCDAQVRCLVGAVGTAKTTTCLWEVGFNLPRRIYNYYGISHTKWFVTRRTYGELMDTDFESAMSWFIHAQWHGGEKTMTLEWPASESCESPLTVELLFRACNTPDAEDKFRSTEVTGAWIDESIGVHRIVKKIIMSRLGRFPKKEDTPAGYTPRYMLESTNPPSVEDDMYCNYKWVGPEVLVAPQRDPKTGNPIWSTGKYDTDKLVQKLPPGPIPPRAPLPGYLGFWQDRGENMENLREGYWEDIKRDFSETPEMIDLMVDGKPGYKPSGKPVYGNFKRDVHMAEGPLVWKREPDPYTGIVRGVKLFMGWDNNAKVKNAAVLAQVVGPWRVQVLREYYDPNERMGIIDLTNYIMSKVAVEFPEAEILHYADPAGFAEFSDGKSGMTSNAKLQQEVCGIQIIASDNSWDHRFNSVDQMLARRDGLLIDPSCIRLLNGFFGGYVFEENPRVGDKEYKPMPRKDKFATVHEALQYIMVKLFSPMAKFPFDHKTDDELWEEAMASRPSARSHGWQDTVVRQRFKRDERGDRANTGGDPRRSI